MPPLGPLDTPRFRGEIVIRRFLIVLSTLALLGSAAPAYADGYADIKAAIAERANDQLDKAIQLLTRAITLGGLDKTALATAYDLRGNAFDDKGDFERAAADYDRAIRTKPDFAQAYNDRGIVRSDLGNFDAAIADYNHALKLNPNSAQAYNNRGIAYHHKADEGQAIADYTKAIALNPRYAHAYYNRAIALHLRGDEAGARKDYYKAIALDPKLEKGP